MQNPSAYARYTEAIVRGLPRVIFCAWHRTRGVHQPWVISLEFSFLSYHFALLAYDMVVNSTERHPSDRLHRDRTTARHCEGKPPLRHCSHRIALYNLLSRDTPTLRSAAITRHPVIQFHRAAQAQRRELPDLRRQARQLIVAEAATLSSDVSCPISAGTLVS